MLSNSSFNCELLREALCSHGSLPIPAFVLLHFEVVSFGGCMYWESWFWTNFAFEVSGMGSLPDFLWPKSSVLTFKATFPKGKATQKWSFIGLFDKLLLLWWMNRKGFHDEIHLWNRDSNNFRPFFLNLEHEFPRGWHRSASVDSFFYTRGLLRKIPDFSQLLAKYQCTENNLGSLTIFRFVGLFLLVSDSTGLFGNSGICMLKRVLELCFSNFPLELPGIL